MHKGVYIGKTLVHNVQTVMGRAWVFWRIGALTFISWRVKICSNSIHIYKSCDEERTRQYSLQRADGWCESVCRTSDPLTSELEAPKVYHLVDVSRICYVSA